MQEEKEYTEYKNCRLCPRKCGVNRYISNGFCRESNVIRAARAGLHMWEEPCISGFGGSGAVFFSGCNLQCVFCQNRDISRGGCGTEISVERLIEIFHELRDQGADNINLVTGDIFIPTIRHAIETAKNAGFDLPFILNTSSFVNVETLKTLEGLIDIYLPDLKYIRDEDAIRLSRAAGYVESSKAAIDEMVRQQPRCEFTGITADNSLIKKGVIVRHLLIPGMLIQAKLIVKYLYDRYGDDICISLLSQYTPNNDLNKYPDINRKVTQTEYRSLVRYTQDLGVTNAYVQELDSADLSFIPSFNLTGI